MMIVNIWIKQKEFDGVNLLILLMLLLLIFLLLLLLIIIIIIIIIINYFNRLTIDISHEKTWMWLRKRNSKRETESLLIATKNNAISANDIEAGIDKT